MIICNDDDCQGVCHFQGDIGDQDEWKCEKCGTVYGLVKVMINKEIG